MECTNKALCFLVLSIDFIWSSCDKTQQSSASRVSTEDSMTPFYIHKEGKKPTKISNSKFEFKYPLISFATISKNHPTTNEEKKYSFLLFPLERVREKDRKENEKSTLKVYLHIV